MQKGIKSSSISAATKYDPMNINMCARMCMMWVHMQTFLCVSVYMCAPNVNGGQRTGLVLVLTLQPVGDKASVGHDSMPVSLA